jgi:hypothetical protein
MCKVGLPGWVIDEPQVELPLRQYCRMVTQPDIQTVRVLLRILVPAAAVVAVLHRLHVLVHGKLGGDGDHPSLVEGRAHDGEVNISPRHQAERSASDEHRVADGTEHSVKVKLCADVLRLRLQCSLPGQEFRWLVAAALRHVTHSASTDVPRHSGFT